MILFNNANNKYQRIDTKWLISQILEDLVNIFLWTLITSVVIKMLLRHRAHCSLWVGWCGGGGHLYIKTWKHDTYSLNVYKTHSILVLIYSKHCFTFGISNLFTELDEGELAIESDSNTYKFCSSILIFSTHHWQIWQNHQRMMVRNKFGFFFSFGVPRCSPGWSGKWSLSDQCAKFKYPMFMWNCSKKL